MVKSGKVWDENLKRFFIVWLKLKIETKMRKGKYASKIKTDHFINLLLLLNVLSL